MERASRLGFGPDVLPGADAGPAVRPRRRSADSVVQRSVGFEFETEQWHLRRRFLLSPPLIKNTQLATGDGWYMQPDGDSVEFATHPFDEGDFDGLRDTMQDLRAYTDALTADRDDGPLNIDDYEGDTSLGFFYTIEPGDAQMQASPQFTAGISLGSLRTMMRHLGTPGSNARENLNNEPGQGRTLMLAAQGADIGNVSEPYRGIVALMGSYAAMSSMKQFVNFYKDIAPLMSRTRLGLAFQTTAEYRAAQEEDAETGFLGSWLFPFSSIDELKSDFEEHVIAAADHVVANQGIYHEPVPIGPGMRMLPGILGPEGIGPRTGPTLREWTDSVVDGRDALAGTYMNLLKWAERWDLRDPRWITSTSMGTMNRTEEVGPDDVESPILEYRNLPTGVSHDAWRPLAHRLLRWVTRLNDPNIGTNSY